jgi:hypothetical protein
VQAQGASQVTAVRSLLAAAICACVLVLVPGAALANDAPRISTSAALAANAADNHLQGADHADRSELGGVTVKRQSRKPRRTNRRLRVRSGDGFRSGCARTVMRGRAADQMNLNGSKRHRAKRALMRRLMAVRGGLQA